MRHVGSAVGKRINVPNIHERISMAVEYVVVFVVAVVVVVVVVVDANFDGGGDDGGEADHACWPAHRLHHGDHNGVRGAAAA